MFGEDVLGGAGDELFVRELGVEAGRRALSDPRALFAILTTFPQATLELLRTGGLSANLSPHGGWPGLSMDFLIAMDSRMVAAKYGVHADDQ